jgi:hypothetical protein
LRPGIVDQGPLGHNHIRPFCVPNASFLHLTFDYRDYFNSIFAVIAPFLALRNFNHLSRGRIQRRHKMTIGLVDFIPTVTS